MPPKTASQQVGAYDNEPDLLGVARNKESNATVRSSERGTLNVEEVVGDIFDAPPNAVLIHACNCIGDWGAGIAAAFKKHYPSAHRIHKEFCKNGPDGKADPATAQLISPVNGQARRHYVGCLFTSVHFGKKRDSPELILENTGPAMEDLLRQVAEESQTREVTELRICKINSGLFQVPWEDTVKVLQNIKLEPGMPTTVTAFDRP
ncbi:appr-1-p processing protein [Diplodia corticola]|uniref:ADP-ribose 1''-phosphate phosphatase n=1 Tax=Diplodia corticola TaxID=236234 RepID=A0A1J9RLJ2_9PEZI|nr:appr-1-p processing protein [Diplodia corticola]OJD40834.1 appr-1-p processing protein [Diplodia corticola]